MIFPELTLKAICIEEIFAFFMALDSTFCASDALSSDAPEQSLAFITICRTCS